jgi:hypothetical protein
MNYYFFNFFFFSPPAKHAKPNAAILAKQILETKVLSLLSYNFGLNQSPPHPLLCL